MKQKIVLINMFFLLFSIGACAQINHFIYLQTENKQPFYVKLDKILFSSSSSGYLIIPKLKDGTYKLSVGFPKNEWQEQVFNCKIAQTDAGYLLKNFGEKGWGLFNLQSLDITMSGNIIEPTVVKDQVKSDEFSTLLSNVVNDPSILKKETIQPAKVDSSKLLSEQKSSPVAEPLPIAKTSPKQIQDSALAKTTASIEKITVNENSGVYNLVYIDKTLAKNDTISIFIPLEEPAIENHVTNSNKPEKKDRPKVKEQEKMIGVEKEIPVKEVVTIKSTELQPVNLHENMTLAKDVVTPKVDVVDSLPKNPNNAKELVTVKVEESVKFKPEKFLPIELSPMNLSVDSVKNEVKENSQVNNLREFKSDSAIVKPIATMVNSDCFVNASDDDFLKLRKKMAAVSSDEEMLSIAKKAFKQKCFSTEQVKNLGVLFLKDASKYSFFDLAYPFVWDSSNYGALQNQLVDPYFNNRFKAMIRH